MPPAAPPSPILLGDIAAVARRFGHGFDATRRAGAIAFFGTRERAVLPLGLLVQAQDARGGVDFEVRSERAPGIAVHLVLEGRVSAWLDGVPLRLGRSNGEPVRIVLTATGAVLPFRRRVHRGARLRKVGIVASWNWLAERGIGQDTVLAGRALRQESWLATEEEIALAERLIRCAGEKAGTVGCPLLREQAALTLLGRALEQLSSPAGETCSGERARLARMEAFATRPGPMPTLGEIAAQGGMSVSSMQRLFHRSHRVPALARLRGLRLESAAESLRAGESVAEAARGAGYISAAAFATAFRRAFGQSPSALRRGTTPSVSSGPSPE